MIIAIVRFPLPAGTTAEQAKASFEASVPQFQGVPGLLRKHYLFGEGPEAGGVYLWTDCAAAEKVYTPEFRKHLADMFGQEPSIEFFESSVTIENAPVPADA